MNYEEAFYILTDWFHSYKDHNGVQVHERHITPQYREAEEKIRELIYLQRHAPNSALSPLSVAAVMQLRKAMDLQPVNNITATNADMIAKIKTFKISRVCRMTEESHELPRNQAERKEFLLSCHDRLCALEDIIFGTKETKE